MGMTITQMPCNPGNYTAKRSSAIRYLVVHYTGAGTEPSGYATREEAAIMVLRAAGK